jgi:hypothetical protein
MNVLENFTMQNAQLSNIIGGTHWYVSGTEVSPAGATTYDVALWGSEGTTGEYKCGCPDSTAGVLETIGEEIDPC